MLNRKELFHRNLPDENLERNTQVQARPENGELPVVENSGLGNSNNIESDNSLRAVPARNLPVRLSEHIPNRSSNQRSNNLQRGHSSHANRRAATGSKTVKRVKGKALAIMNEVEVISKSIINSHDSL